ncbi:uncharacterized protein LOC110724527 isoform X1 [Chenopodium quinoa]|uniref:uncharacterized protein LOC110724527 isoform X1 n=1 Tax=Chenopodium quinoa TaxID=63459 RepID=UPI000B791048|nr:uncharacterized protein LOC110724527 isoform X1 [Chenopodium quinoa]
MKYLSEMCKQDSVAGMYGFCDIGYLSPLTPMTEEGRSDYLASVFGQNEGKNLNQLFFAPYKENPWNAVVFWLDPDGAENEISEFAQKTINEYVVHHIFIISTYNVLKISLLSLCCDCLIYEDVYYNIDNY